METISSTDGTPLAVERTGTGPALVVAAGALCDRAAFADLADLLADTFTVYRYDRRGRGDSGDAATYAPQREYEDLEAVVEHAGGAAVFGHSSGAALALQAAAHGVAVRALVAYEPPYDTGAPDPDAHAALLADLRGFAGRPADAVRYWMAGTGMGDADIELWPTYHRMVAAAPTLTYEVELLGDRLPDLSGVTAPTTVLGGAASPPFLLDAVAAVADAVPAAVRRLLPGQGHDVGAAALAPVLREVLTRGATA